MDRVKIGTGPLTWPRMERVTDRYGSVFFHATSSTDEPLDPVDCDPAGFKEHIGKKGKLVAEVINARESSHIGDLTHGFFPSKPDVGEKIELGEGELFYEFQDHQYHAVGLLPEDGRKTFWMTPQNLYRAHEQTVILWFVPSP
jgi:hypothetical protein